MAVNTHFFFLKRYNVLASLLPVVGSEEKEDQQLQLLYQCVTQQVNVFYVHKHFYIVNLTFILLYTQPVPVSSLFIVLEALSIKHFMAVNTHFRLLKRLYGFGS